MIGEFLYQLTPRDSVVAGMEYFEAIQSASQNATSINLYWRIPFGKALWLQSANGDARPGAVSNIPLVELLVGPAVALLGTQIGPIQRHKGTTGREQFNLNNPVLLPPDYLLQMRCEFSAAEVGNTLVGTLTGWFIPRGNLGEASLPVGP